MAPETGNIFHTNPVDFPVLMTAQTGLLIGSEGMRSPAVTILADQVLREHMPGVPR